MRPEDKQEIVIDLVEQLISGEISEDDAARLDELVATDEEAAAVYIRYMHLHATLANFQEDVLAEETADAPAARPKSRDWSPPLRVPRRANRSRAVLAVTTLILLATVSYFVVDALPRSDAPAPEQLVSVALSTSNVTERERATLALSRHPKQPITQIRQVFEQTDSSRVKAATMRGMAKLRDWESGPKLIELLRSDSEYLRDRAADTLNHIAREDFGFRANDPETKRRRIIEVIKRKWPLLHEGYQAKANVEAIRAGFERKRREMEENS